VTVAGEGPKQTGEEKGKKEKKGKGNLSPIPSGKKRGKNQNENMSKDESKPIR